MNRNGIAVIVIAESYVVRCSSVTSPGKAGCGQLALLHTSGVSNKLLWSGSRLAPPSSLWARPSTVVSWRWRQNCCQHCWRNVWQPTRRHFPQDVIVPNQRRKNKVFPHVSHCCLHRASVSRYLSNNNTTTT